MYDMWHPITHPPASCISEPATPFINDGTSCADKASCNYQCATNYVATAGTEPEAVTCVAAGTGWHTMTPATLVCSGCGLQQDSCPPSCMHSAESQNMPFAVRKSVCISRVQVLCTSVADTGILSRLVCVKIQRTIGGAQGGCHV